eukprot:4032631-Pyramimonas_sp.AAC.1
MSPRDPPPRLARGSPGASSQLPRNGPAEAPAALKPTSTSSPWPPRNSVVGVASVVVVVVVVFLSRGGVSAEWRWPLG